MNLGHLKFELERIGSYSKWIAWGMIFDVWVRSHGISYWLVIPVVIAGLFVASWFDRKFVRGGELEKGLKDNPEWRDKIK